MSKNTHEKNQVDYEVVEHDDRGTVLQTLSKCGKKVRVIGIDLLGAERILTQATLVDSPLYVTCPYCGKQQIPVVWAWTPHCYICVDCRRGCNEQYWHKWLDNFTFTPAEHKLIDWSEL